MENIFMIREWVGCGHKKKLITHSEFGIFTTCEEAVKFNEKLQRAGNLRCFPQHGRYKGGVFTPTNSFN
jgi:hypothetical protein